MKQKIIITTITILILTLAVFLGTNKTFYKTTYIGTNNQQIFIPRYSYFQKECCMTAATFYSLKSKNHLKREIQKYLQKFQYFEDETTYGYQKTIYLSKVTM